MVGTALNVATVVVGALAGKAIGDRFPPRIRETVMHVIGLMTLVIGAAMALKRENELILLGSLILGGVTGELLRIEAAIERLGTLAERRFAGKDGDGLFSRGFVTTSILFCVGPVTLLGCLNDGLRGDYGLLAVKATLDGVSAVAFASALGWGVLLSAATVLVVQGSLTLGARSLEPLLRDTAMQSALFSAGGVMMLGLGFRLLELKPIRVANLLPALLWAPLLVHVARLLER